MHIPETLERFLQPPAKRDPMNPTPKNLIQLIDAEDPNGFDVLALMTHIDAVPDDDEELFAQYDAFPAEETEQEDLDLFDLMYGQSLTLRT